MVVVQRQANLLEIVAALGSAGRLASRLNRRKKKCDQNANDRDHHQQFDKSETLKNTTHPSPLFLALPYRNGMGEQLEHGTMIPGNQTPKTMAYGRHDNEATNKPRYLRQARQTKNKSPRALAPKSE